MEPRKSVLEAAACPEFDSFVDLMRYQALQRPRQTALIFLPDGETEVGRVSYSELDRRARAFAARLQALDLAGECVLLMMPSSIYYVVAFLGCLYAKAIPVPTYPPTSSMHAQRLSLIVKDCNAKGAILTTPGLQDGIQSKLSQFLPDGLGCALLSIDDLPMIDADSWAEPALTPEALAYLQYTSGSTSEPRGVMVTHRNLIEHGRHLQLGCQQNQTDVYVTWLPLFHDMGLISGVIQPFYVGGTTVLMPSMAFLQKPIRWLAAISRYRGTSSFAPNFAYELCAATLDEVQRKTLDLSSWTVAMNGAEPVRASTIRNFCERFASCGFQPEAMSPGYGLAEATLAVACKTRMVLPSICAVDGDALASNRLVPALTQDTRTCELVSAGCSRLGVRTVIVDPLTCTPCAGGCVGEIWVQGPIVADGYWGRPELTATTFQAHLADGDGPFLRTGDLGVLHNGELYVTGRIKDLIIIRGRNHYPQDIEQTAFRAHAAVEIGHGAAFSVEHDGQEKLVIVQEIRRSWRKRFDGTEVAQAICHAVAEHHGLQVHELLLLKPASVHITSSGKIQRQACKADYLHHRFEALHIWSGKTMAAEQPTAEPAQPDLAADQQYHAIAAWLVQKICDKKGLAPDKVSRDAAFHSFGCDSLDLVALSGELAAWLGRPIGPGLMYDYPTITRIARHVSGVEHSTASFRAQVPPPGADPAAILGMACRFPGAASVPDFWRLLLGGTHAISEVPASRWKADNYYQAGASAPGKMNTRWGGFIEGVDQFDAHFFGISPREADSMDPQQRLLLEVTWHALEHAGIAPDSLAGSNTGVFIGICSGDYRQLQLDHGAGADTYSGTGNAYSIAANRISYLLDLRGPSMAIDTACSSSLVAVHQACASLRARECDLAIVGGVNLILAPSNTIVFSQAQMMAADGLCKTFDASANGYVRSEGCGVIILRRLTDAQTDNDPILALIPGSAINQDGKSNGLTAPNGVAQQAVMRQALASAGMIPAQVSYIEAHGTGTNLGDPIEMSALNAVYGEQSGADSPLWIGSVKTNVGHLEAAAGIAGLIKVVLAMQHQQIPAHLHLRQLNSKISLKASRCAIATAPQAWPAAALPRLAGISSFGFGGANAHVLLQEAPTEHECATESAPVTDTAWNLLVLSAKNKAALAQLVQAYVDFLPQTTASFAAICQTACAHRSHHPVRLSLLARSRQEAGEALARYQAGQGADSAAICTSVSVDTAPGKTAFLFTGQGAQYVGMGLSLYKVHAGFRRTLRHCDAILRPLMGQSLLSVLAGEGGVDLTHTSLAQPALFALEYALAGVWQSCGIKPDYLLGHSLGEYVAACIAGVFSLEDGLALVAHRGRLMHSACVPGVMLAVHAPAHVIEAFLQSFQSQGVCVAAHNSPQDIVLSGDVQAVQALATTLADTGATATPLQVDRAFHSPLMQGMIAEFKRYAEAITYRSPCIPVISNVTGRVASADEMANADYWVRHVLKPVLFAQGLNALEQSGCHTYVEIGPHPVLTTFGQQMMSGGVWLHSLRRSHDEDQQFQQSLGQCYAAGNTIDWKHWLLKRAGVDKLPKPEFCPPYPFQPERHWFTSGAEPRLAARISPATEHPLLGEMLDIAGMPHHCFSNTWSAARPWFIDQHRVFGTPVLPAAAMIEWALSGLSKTVAKSSDGWVLQQLSFSAVMVIPEGDETTVQLTIDEQGNTYRVRCFSRQEGSWIEHASMQAQRKQALASATDVCFDALKRSLQQQSAEACYELCQAGGLNYGPAFRGMRGLWTGGNQALAQIECAVADDEVRLCYMHPVILDACFHTLLAFFNLDTPATVLLPVGAQRLVAYRSLPAQLWCRAVWHGEQADGRYSADLELFALNGEPIAHIQGLQLATVSRSMFEPISEEPIPDSYEVRWVPMPLAASQMQPKLADPTAPWLIYCADAVLARDILKQFSALGYEALAVVTGTHFECVDTTLICIDPCSKPDIEQMFAWLKQSHTRLSGLLLWADDSHAIAGVNASMLDQTYALAQASFLFLQSFLNAYSSGAPQILVCTRGACMVDVPSTDVSCMSDSGLAQSVLGGLAKAVIAEFAHIPCIQIDLDPRATLPSMQTLLQNGALHSGAGHIALRQEKWYEARLQACEPVQRSLRNTIIRDDAHYLITGGLGGLGRCVAKWLVHNGARFLILAGRSLPADSSDFIHNLEQAGAQVTLMQVDIACESAWTSARLQLEHCQPPLRGIVHAAGLIDDGVLHELDWSRFANVMDSKVRGGWHLHMLTEQLALDFFSCFSSFTAVIGSAGQANYMAANSFLDSLAHYRRQRGLPATSINWGPWSDVGMATQLQVKARLAHIGMSCISPAMGMQAFASALATQPVQIGFATVDWSAYNAAMVRKLPYTLISDVLLAELSTNAFRTSISQQMAEVASLAPSEAREVLTAYVLQAVGRALRLSAAREDELRPAFLHQKLNTLGLDSLMAMELRNKMLVELSVDVPIHHFLGGSEVGEVIDLIYTQLMIRKMVSVEAMAAHSDTEIEVFTL